MSRFFSHEYSEARAHFLETCKSSRATIRSYRHERVNGQLPVDLVIDTARFGPTNASRILVLISGTHGVEGFCGSACQIAAVESGSWNPIPADMSIFLIHGLNPYGFATLRRVDVENVDLNRNFVEDFEALAGYNPEYDQLNDALNPTRWRETDPQDGDDVIKTFITTEGMKKFQDVVSIGQYRHPGGIFFGGRRKAWSRMILEEIVEAEFQNARSVGVIDYHTGLGSHGEGELISFAPEDSILYKRSVDWCGPKVKSTKSKAANLAAVAADVGGAIDGAFLGNDRIVTFLSLEFGTVPIPAVLRALRAENWLVKYGESDSELGKRIKADLRSAFYPTDQSWKDMVLSRSKEVVAQVIAGLSNT
jgi:hypothetical protein